MPKFFFSFLFSLFIVFQAEAQEKQLVALKKVCRSLDSCLSRASTDYLKNILHPSLSFGHSNGLIENKTELLEHLQTQYLKYTEIIALDTPKIIQLKKLATVRRTIAVKGTLQGKNFETKLRVMETWVKKGRNWLLLNRQSAKIT